MPAASSRIQASVSRLLSLGPSRVDHIPAFRIALGLAIPLSVLLLTGRIEWAMYVGFGAFTGIYSKYEPTRMRFRRQSMAGALLTVCVTMGAALAQLGESLSDRAESWLALGVGAVVAGLAATVVLQFLAEMYVLRNYSFALLFVTPLALLMVQLAHPQPVGVILEARVVETAIGALVGIAVVIAAALWDRREALRRLAAEKGGGVGGE